MRGNQLRIIRDDPHALRAAFIEADSRGGCGDQFPAVFPVGEADYTKTILEELGEIAFWKLAIKPGIKPFAFGKLSNSWFCGLPEQPGFSDADLLSTGTAFAGKTKRQTPPAVCLRASAYCIASRLKKRRTS